MFSNVFKRGGWRCQVEAHGSEAAQHRTRIPGVATVGIKTSKPSRIPPRYPLADYRIVVGDGEDAAAEKAWKDRERSVWKMLWKTPQACAWSLPENAYLSWDVALYCRQIVLCEQAGATASDRALLPRFADRIGLSAAGLAALGWRIVPDKAGAARMAKQAEEPDEQPEPARRERIAW